MAEWVRALVWFESTGSTWWKEMTDACKLPFDPHMGATALMYTHAWADMDTRLTYTHTHMCSCAQNQQRIVMQSFKSHLCGTLSVLCSEAIALLHSASFPFHPLSSPPPLFPINIISIKYFYDSLSSNISWITWASVVWLRFQSPCSSFWLFPAGHITGKLPLLFWFVVRNLVWSQHGGSLL
jgi:hypothetical protein